MAMFGEWVGGSVVHYSAILLSGLLFLYHSFQTILQQRLKLQAAVLRISPADIRYGRTNHSILLIPCSNPFILCHAM